MDLARPSSERLSAASCLLGCGVLSLSLALGACAHGPTDPPLLGLSVGIAELELHLRDDPYRSFNHLDAEGRNVFASTRWKLERLQRERAREHRPWELGDYVVELARARTLERLHLYREALHAYQRVEDGPAELAGPAQLARATLEQFASLAEPLLQPSPTDEALGEIDARITAWLTLSREMKDASYAALALEEAESWEILRVRLLARREGPEGAVAACERLIQSHRESKLRARHLMMLGDLHAQAARDVALWARALETALTDTAFDQHFEAALAAYESASESRTAVFRSEAQARIQAMLSYHDGVAHGAY